MAPGYRGRSDGGPLKVERTLLIAGLILFLAGLLAGMVIPALPNPRAGLAAHLDGLLNGLFLMIVALAWRHIALGFWASAITRGLLLVGTWVGFFATELSALLGTSALTPISGAGFTAPPLAELLVGLMVITTVPTMVPATFILCWGAMRGRG